MLHLFRSRRTLVSLPVFCSLALFGCRRQPSSDAPQGPPAVAVAAVQRGTIAHTLSLAGQFQPFQEVEVHAKVAGYLRHIYVDIGDRVRAGQTLATLEVPELNAQYSGTRSEALRSREAITSAGGELSRARALHASLQANFDRLQQAAKEQPGVIAAQELDNARSQADASASQVDAAQAALAGAKQGAEAAAADQQRVGALQGYTTITAPLAGVITWRYADTGALIQTGTNSETQSMPIVKLAQSGLLRLRVPVPEDAVRYVHEGDTMQITVAALGQQFPGTVVRFSRSLDPATRTMQTEVDVPNKNLRITPGMYANTYLTLAHRDNVLTVPLAAVASDNTTWVLDPQNRARKRTVATGLRGSRLLEVTGGLELGDRVVLGGAETLKDGEAVTPRLQTEPANDVQREEGGMVDPFASDAGDKGGA